MERLKRLKIHRQIRHRLSGTSQRPRLAVYRSLNNIFAQLIDDQKGLTLISTSSLKMSGSLTAKAKLVGQEIAAQAKAKKIKELVFDRGGFSYGGAVKTLAEEVRENGLKI